MLGVRTWVAQSVKQLTSVQVMISQFVGLSPELGSVLTAGSLEPASDSVSPSLSAPPSACSLSKINKHYEIKIKVLVTRVFYSNAFRRIMAKPCWSPILRYPT